MDDSSRRADCARHGIREATFVCQHLVAGVSAGFHWGFDEDEPDRIWPDAWCDACERVRGSEGGWNDRSEAFAAVRLLCDRCYEAARERNWRQDDEAFESLLREASAHLHEQQAQLQSRYALGSYPRYDWSQDTGQLVFSRDGHAGIVADVQFVGTLSTRSQTWLWSWANPSIVEPVKERVRHVRAYGEMHRYLRLASASWSAQEADGWEMTAIAAYLLGAMGAYRSPEERGFSFLVMTDVHRAH